MTGLTPGFPTGKRTVIARSAWSPFRANGSAWEGKKRVGNDHSVNFYGNPYSYSVYAG